MFDLNFIYQWQHKGETFNMVLLSMHKVFEQFLKIRVFGKKKKSA